MNTAFSIALVGNPNCGKTSLFNALTGLNQRVGNFAGVTVDKKTGACRLPSGEGVLVTDLPGTYSIYPKSKDEQVVFDVLLSQGRKPDAIVLIADASALKRNLLLCSQIMDLKIPVVIALTMADIARSKGITINTEELQRQMGVPVVLLNPRKNKGTDKLLTALQTVLKRPSSPAADFIDMKDLCGERIGEAAQVLQTNSLYAALQICCRMPDTPFLTGAQITALASFMAETEFNRSKIQAEEIVRRYRKIDKVLSQSMHQESPQLKALRSERFDRALLHPVWGNVILLVVLFLLFQSIFSLSAYPMDAVELFFTRSGAWLADVLPEGWLSDLAVNGIWAGLGGIAVFVPQIMILFGLITILEDSGYMARIAFLTDRIMRSAGLSGRSVMPLISGMACAVPAIMAARTIGNKKERLITILITPLMSCSARLPVYSVLIGLVIPERKVLGIFNVQGLVLMGLYLLSFAAALAVAKIAAFFLQTSERSFYLMELPVYKAPRWKNVGITMLEKAKVFVRDAGKVILFISIVLWALSAYGPAQQMQAVNDKYALLEKLEPERAPEWAEARAAERLEQSYAGRLGHAVEPAIRPLGYDWKIGIALISSFAAREVFVGTMATLYSVGGSEASQELSLREKMSRARRPDGSPVYTLASGVSLLLFYVFALQCMSTLAISKRETGSWKWPAIQFLYMGLLAYGFAFAAYSLLR